MDYVYRDGGAYFQLNMEGGGGRRGGVDLITSVRDAGLLGDLGPSSPRKV